LREVLAKAGAQHFLEDVSQLPPLVVALEARAGAAR
jgi:hypothetical protein